MRSIYAQAFILFFIVIFESCTIYEKKFDNPVDFKANEEQGIDAPTLVFYPKTQILNLTDSILISSFIVFKEDSAEFFSGIQLRIDFPNNLMELDTVLPGQFITDSLQSTPLFTYTYNNERTLDIFAYFLDTVKIDIEGTGHLADLVFRPLTSGDDSISYDLNECIVIDYQDTIIEINGIRGAEIIIR